MESASRPVRRVASALLALLALLTVTAVLQVGEPAVAAPPTPSAQATAIGTGGAAASGDPLATETGLGALRRGGPAASAAVSAAAVLGVVDAFSCGVGGGGFMTIYRAGDGRVFSLDGRETAPQAFRPDSFIDPATGLPIPFAEGVTSGLGVGVPGTPRLWEEALARFGRIPVAAALAPAIAIARAGFEVAQPFHAQVASTLARFSAFTSTRELYGAAPAVGSIFRNPDLAMTYQTLAAHGMDAFYGGPLAGAVGQTGQHPPLGPGGARE